VVLLKYATYYTILNQKQTDFIADDTEIFFEEFQVEFRLMRFLCHPLRVVYVFQKHLFFFKIISKKMFMDPKILVFRGP